ncbi:MAG: response regulator [Hyphomicrobiales bacterium]
MVVDDSDSMRRLYRTCLSTFGITNLRMFDSGLAALDEAKDHPPDLVIVDWRMGPPNGLDFLRRLRCAELGPVSFTAAIMVTGHASESFVKRAMRAGAQQFLVKPVSPRLLYERIEWVTGDARELVQQGKRFVIDGVEERLKWHERAETDSLTEALDIIEV